jgi:hypothetical protein
LGGFSIVKVTSVSLILLRMASGCLQKKKKRGGSALKGRRFRDTENIKNVTSLKAIPQ